MKGIVFNVLEDVVSAAHGEEAWDDLLDSAGLDGAYTSLGSYPDEQLHALVELASARLDIPRHDLIRWFGRKSAGHFAQRYPQFFAPHTGTRPFLLTLNDVIHAEVRKLYPGASVPDFDFDDRRDGRLGMIYRSAKKMCAFGEGLILGAGDHYRETVTVEQPACMHRGDDHCLLLCSFGGGQA